jgi:hypothetical protein
LQQTDTRLILQTSPGAASDAQSKKSNRLRFPLTLLRCILSILAALSASRCDLPIDVDDVF